MLALDTEIQCLKSGATSLVQDLEAGSLVFNPITDTHVAVTEILSRQIVPWVGTNDERAQILPIRLQAGKLGGGLPTKDLITSAGQRMLICEAGSGSASIKEYSAGTLFASGLAAEDSTRMVLPFTLYLIIFEKPTVFIANGVMMTGLYSADLNVPLRNRTPAPMFRRSAASRQFKG